MYWDIEDLVPIILGVLVVTMLVAIPILAVQEEHEWQQFAEAHACKVVGQVESDISMGVGPTSGGNVGVVIVPIPGKTGWLCDDGVTYWR